MTKIYGNKSVYTKKYERFFNNKKCSDVVIVTQNGNEIYCHKVILESCEYFSEKFENNVIRIDGVEEGDLIDFLLFLYRGKSDETSNIISLDILSKQVIPKIKKVQN
jgi:hypothetical protein